MCDHCLVCQYLNFQWVEWRDPFRRHELCSKFYTADFQSKIFIPSISPNFNSFSERNTKISENGEIHTAGKISHSRRWGYQVSKSWLWGWCCRCWMLKLISMLMTDLMPLLTLAIKMICILFFPEYPKYQKWHIYTRLKIHKQTFKLKILDMTWLVSGLLIKAVSTSSLYFH